MSALKNNDSPIVVANNIDFGFDDRLIYNNLSLTLPRGKVTVIMGPSGCGKSTLLSLIGGRIRPQSGEMLFDGESVGKARGDDLYRLRRKMGMLFQNSALLTDLNTFDNIAYPLREQTNLDEALIRIVTLMKLELVGLRGADDLMPAELSGGMARRVALARAIALDPSLIMYDEPFVGLDPISMGVIVKLIRELNDALDLTSVVVTHDVAEGLSIADYAYILGNGSVLGHGTADEIRQSEEPMVKQFIGGLADGPVPYRYPAGEYASDLRGDQ
ncbi:MAG: phospholipid/cholesterol/gamma-HCH transport system ATP-binding protein [Saprospiraceae bacterium]|jgi:phospholipid/cholesterol/gamma-HCH transport system ATP-binding protein